MVVADSTSSRRARNRKPSLHNNSNKGLVAGLPRSEMTSHAFPTTDMEETLGQGQDMESLLQDVLNPVVKQLDFAGRLGQELVAQRAALTSLQTRWNDAKDQGNTNETRQIEKEIKACRTENANTIMSRLKQIAESVSLK